MPKCVQLSNLSEKSNELMAKILRAVLERSRDALEKIGGKNFVKLLDGNVSEFQKKKAGGMIAKVFFTINVKDETHKMMMEIEPLLMALDYRTWRNILLTHGEYPCHCLAQTFWYPIRANLET